MLCLLGSEMSARLITHKEAEVLREALIERGEIRFPLGLMVGSFLAGTIYGLKKRKAPFKPRLRNKIVARLSDGYASVLAFVLWVGPENVDVWDVREVEDGKMGKNYFYVKLKHNKALKCAPTGPDAASLRRLT